MVVVRLLAPPLPCRPGEWDGTVLALGGVRFLAFAPILGGGSIETEGPNLTVVCLKYLPARRLFPCGRDPPPPPPLLLLLEFIVVRTYSLICDHDTEAVMASEDTHLTARLRLARSEGARTKVSG